MCTLTWGRIEQGIGSSTGYHVHFNRDESRVRQQAIHPKLHSSESHQYLAPIDRDAMGTWILVNAFGLTACLLNNYINVKRTTGQRSRGLLLRDLNIAKDIQHAEDILNQAAIEQYAPFDIFLFDQQATLNIGWNGEIQTRIHNPENFKSSSGFDTDLAIKTRQSNFQFENKDVDKLRHYHSSHIPEKSAYSVCMHRPDARTQSYTEIVVNDGIASMRYSDGPPCTSELSSPVHLLLA